MKSRIAIILSAIIYILIFHCQAFATPATMRLDYYHTGNASQELFSLDRIVVEPLPWPGNPKRMIDNTNLGKYFFEVIDRNSNSVIYSRGFSSIFAEWQDTDEAKKINRTYNESLRFPAPEGVVQIVLKKRDALNAFHEVWSVIVDPKDIFIDRSKPAAPANLLEIMKNGDPADKVDLLILGDGYTAKEEKKFEQDARRMTEILFSTSPFKERRSDFNVWGLCPAAAESGISRPSTGVYHDSPIGASYDAFGSERYILTFNNRAFRDIAEFAPYDFVEILTNSRTYGGGGIFNLYGTVAADNLFSPYIFVHEFGHHIAGLADEYYTSPDVYNAGGERIEPWEPNVTALLDVKNLKWRDLVSPDTPLATPWEKDVFESYSRQAQKKRVEIRRENRPEEEMEALFREEKEHEDQLFAKEKYAGKVGAFEGANYEAKGYYRPQIDCIMFTRSNAFCVVCRHAIERIIDLYSR